MASRGQSSAAASSTSLASPESLDADEFFSLMHLLTILCKLILFGYNGIEKQHAKAVSVGIDGGSAAITFEKIVRALPIGSKSDLANSFLETLDHCMAIWRMRYDSISFHVQLGDKRLPPPPFLSYSPPANSTIGTHISHLLQGRLCFPAVEVLKAICRDVSIGNSVDGLLERIFGVRNLVM